MKTLTFLLLSFCSFTFIYSQVTIHVPADYPTIQAAINAATNGDLVLVADGSYLENINFNGKGITVASHFILDDDKSHIENTIIDGSQPSHQDTGSVVLFINGEDTSSVLCGFTITGGTGTFGIVTGGGGILIVDSSPIIRNNIIESNNVISNSRVGGSAVAIELNLNRIVFIENNIIRNNLAKSTSSSGIVNGTVLILQAIGKVIFRNNLIENNILEGDYWSNGGGITANGSNSTNVLLVIENNKFVNNVVTDGTSSTAQLGGAIFIEAINAYVRNNIIVYNRARGSGGIHYWNPFTPQVYPTVENNIIYGNIAGSRYGGGLSTSHEYNIINCIIWGNTTPQYSTSHVANITYSDIEQPYTNGSNNISLEPEFLDTTYFLFNELSACIDSGSPDPMYNDLEDPLNLGYALWPALGTLRNDMGHFGGPNSLWYKWQWPLYYLPTAPLLIAPSDTVYSSEFTFIWSKCTPLVTKYWFEIDTTDQFTTSYIDTLITDTTYFFDNLTYNQSYYWRVKAFNDFGWGNFSDVGSFPVITSVEDENQLPVEFNLSQNYPNPFNPVTTIKYSIPQASKVEIKVFDILGNEVETFVNKEKPIGEYEITWYAESLPSGVYFYRIQAGDFVQTKKMVLMK